jgi:hypothetical protein
MHETRQNVNIVLLNLNMKFMRSVKKLALGSVSVFEETRAADIRYREPRVADQ